MSYPVDYPTPQNANVQIFTGAANNSSFIWTKPQGVSFVWFTLIGHGGNGGAGDGTNAGGGGGSGVVTNCLMPAFLVPDSLNIRTYNPRLTAGATNVFYRTKGTLYQLLAAAQGSAGSAAAGGNGGTSVLSTTFFSCAGVYQSTPGQNGTATGSVSASTSTFLSGGTGSSSPTSVTGNYGYSSSVVGGTPANGYFQFQPIIVGLGAANTSTGVTANGGIGCGGSGQVASGTTTFGYGGPGMVVIISW